MGRQVLNLLKLTALKPALKVLLILLAALNSCNQTSKPDEVLIVPEPLRVDTTNKEIYDFMKELITMEYLNPTNGLETEPQPNCDLNKPDYEYLNNYLINSNKNLDTFDFSTGIGSATFDLFDRCLTTDDINYMLWQKKAHRGFKWDNSRLGFNKENRESWYIFSIPLFSKDKTSVVMMIRNLCPGLCGNGETVLFKKENGKWVSHPSGFWYH